MNHLLEGLIVVSRFSKPWEPLPEPAERSKPSNRAYRGIDSPPWPHVPQGFGSDPDTLLPNLLEPVHRVGDVERYWEQVAGDRADFLFCSRTPQARPPVMPSGRQFVLQGVDYGDVEWETFSIHFHEVLGGRYPEMREYRRFLNDSLLFASEAPIQQMLETRRILLSAGADLETFGGETWNPWWVHTLER